MISDTIKKGYERAPHRSLLRACGVAEEDFDKPFIAVANVFCSAFGFSMPRHFDRSPCGSASTSKTFLPCLARPIPKFTVVVVFPTPPFSWAHEITLVIGFTSFSILDRWCSVYVRSIL